MKRCCRLVSLFALLSLASGAPSPAPGAVGSGSVPSHSADADHACCDEVSGEVGCISHCVGIPAGLPGYSPFYPQAPSAGALRYIFRAYPDNYLPLLLRPPIA